MTDYDFNRVESAFFQMDYQQALTHAEADLKQYTAQKDPVGEGLARAWRGAALTQLSQFKEAMAELTAAYKQLQQQGRGELAGRALNYIAVIYEELHDFPHAFEYYEKALLASQAQNDDRLTASISANYGEGLVNTGNIDTGLERLAQAIRIGEAIDDNNLVAWSLLVKAKAHVKRKDNEQALECYEHAWEKAEHTGTMRVKAEILTGLGLQLLNYGKLSEALEHLENALVLAQKSGVDMEIHKTNLSLSLALELKGDFKRALQCYKDFHEVGKRVYDELIRAKVGDLRAQLEQTRQELAQAREQLQHQE